MHFQPKIKHTLALLYDARMPEVSSINDRINMDAFLCLSIGAICPLQKCIISHFSSSRAAFLNDDIKMDCNGKVKIVFPFPPGL